MTKMEIRLSPEETQQVITLLEAFAVALRAGFPERLRVAVAEYDDPWDLLTPTRDEPPASSEWLADRVDTVVGIVLEELDHPVPAPTFSGRPSDEWRDALALLQAAVQEGAGSPLVQSLMDGLLEEHDHRGLILALTSLGSNAFKLAASARPGLTESDLLALLSHLMGPGMDEVDQDYAEGVGNDDD
ncbi:hypothetical protein [Jatrophihabitans sp.]|uniref:hypothetical protein n=1 Tax=Jatrophihabitans sp. TaxID=1932789 RepID=UPI0030C67D1A|nr:hypothetical protein [Jatrophihabitans sp.]